MKETVIIIVSWLFVYIVDIYLVDIVEVLLTNIPSAEMYERSLMHRESINQSIKI